MCKVRRALGQSSFFPLHMDVQFFQHHLIKGLFIFHSIVFETLLKIKWQNLCKSILFSFFHWSRCLSFCQFHTVSITVALLSVLNLNIDSFNFILFNYEFNFFKRLWDYSGYLFHLGWIFIVCDFWGTGLLLLSCQMCVVSLNILLKSLEV